MTIYASSNVSLHFFVQLLTICKLQFPCTVLSLPVAYTYLSAKAMEVTQPVRVKQSFNLMELPHNTQKYKVSLNNLGTVVAQWLRCCATNRKVAGSIPASVIGFFIDTKSFRSHYGPGVDSASNRNEYQEHFLGVQAACA